MCFFCRFLWVDECIRRRSGGELPWPVSGGQLPRCVGGQGYPASVLPYGLCQGEILSMCSKPCCWTSSIEQELV